METIEHNIDTLPESTASLGPFALNKVYASDCYDALLKVPSHSIDVAITSPPYWGQRGDEGLGLEEDPREYLAQLTRILLEVMRVIKPDGLLWLNIGDAYNTPMNWRREDYVYSTLGQDGKGLGADNSAYTKNRGRRRAFVSGTASWLTYGNLLALPYRIVISLCEHGVLFRGEVVWYKRKPMPEGRARRPHRKHEGIYILANSERHRFRTTPPVPSVWDLKPDANDTPHRSTYPLALPLACIDAMELRKGTVLDPFMGSGTTGLAAKMRGLDYVGFDTSQAYVAIANARIEKAAWNTQMPLKS